jgi:PAS domain-containing protein
MTARKRTKAKASAATRDAKAIDAQEIACVVRVNRAFYSFFQTTKEETLGKRLYDLADRQWDIPDLRKLLEEILPRNISFNDFELTHDFKKIGRRKMLLNGGRIFVEAGKSELILLAIDDITNHELAG